MVRGVESASDLEGFMSCGRDNVPALAVMKLLLYTHFLKSFRHWIYSATRLLVSQVY
jgi:hypothetical protein